MKKVAYQAALVEALQRTWLDGPRARGIGGGGGGESPSRFLQSVQWVTECSPEEGRGGNGGRQVGGGASRGGGAKEMFAARSGALGAAVLGLGDEIGGYCVFRLWGVAAEGGMCLLEYGI